jgi:hypothetical protein
MKKIAISFAIIVMSAFSAATLPMQRAFAAGCEKDHFMGLPAWYDNLTDADCNVISPSGEEGVKQYVGRLCLMS